MKKQTLKKVWVCQSGDAPPEYASIADSESESIKQFLKARPYLGWSTSDIWEYYKSLGWNCFKVDITFEPCSPE